MSDVSNWSMPTAAPPTQADWNGVYGQTQTYLLNSLFAKHIDAKGNLDESGFYQDAAKNGLSPDQISTAMGYALAQKNNELGQVQTNQYLGLYGADPNAGGRNGATIGAPVKPDIQTIPNPAAQQPTKQASAPAAQSAPPKPSGPTNPLVAASPVVADPVDATAPATPQAPQSPNGFGNFYAQLKAQAAAAKQQLGLGQPTDSVMNANGTTQAPAAPTTPLQIPDRNAQLAQFLGMKAQQANANGNLQAPAPLSASDSQGANSMDLGQGKITPSGATLNADGSTQMQRVDIPPSATTPYQPPTPPDTRSATQRVVDSVDPSKSMMGRMMGTVASGAMDYTKDTPSPILQSGATMLARLHYDNDGTLDSVNNALHQYMQDKVASIGPPPVVPPMKDGRPDMAGLLQQQREWIGKVQGVSLDVHSQLGDANGKQFDQQLAASTNDMALKKMLNDTTLQNAKLRGTSAVAAKTDALLANDPNIGGLHLNPQSFDTPKELNDFSDRATAYSKMGNVPPNSPLDALNFAKNYAYVEKLPNAEGMVNLLMMLGASGAANKLQIALASGAKFDVPTLVGIGASDILQRITPVQLSQLKQGMKFTADYKVHSGANTTPTMQAGGMAVTPYTQTAPAQDSSGAPTVTQPAPTVTQPAPTSSGTAPNTLPKLLGMKGTIDNPISYVNGMKRDPNLVYFLPTSRVKAYGDGRLVQ